jgi:hypothetical protein
LTDSCRQFRRLDQFPKVAAFTPEFKKDVAKKWKFLTINFRQDLAADL